MAKKYKSTKLIKPSAAVQEKPGSAFGQHANRLADARKKKIEKLTDTQKRVMESKKNNKMIKISKKAKKFALLDEENEHDDETMKKMSLTHKGISIKDMKRFDDVNLGESDLENDDEFDNFQEKMHFAGFEATDNLLEDQNNKDNDNDKKEKSKNEVYKEIIEKSKAYKMLRQEQYEENFNLANELDEGFDELVGQLKFRNRDQQLMEKMENRDLEYDKLLNELRDDERVVSNKIVEKNEKYTEKIRKKKNDQLNKLMKDSSDEEDIRGWVDGAEEEDSENDVEEESENEEDYNEEDEEGENSEEGSYDELDDVELSSEEEEEEDGEDDDGENEEEEDGEEVEEDAVGDEASENDLDEDEGEDEDEDEEGEDDEDDEEEASEEEDEDEEEKSDSYQEPVFPQKNNNNKKQQNQPVKSSSQQQVKGNPQKKRKLNFIE